MKVFVEQQIKDHPRVEKFLKKHPAAQIVNCQHYGEVFNPKSQNFRLQKAKPAWILARKNNRFVLPTPEGFGIGGVRNFYLSHLLNCPYDCRYCFLQGMYRSANYVWFVNHEDFLQDVASTIARYPTQRCYFFSGYDADSLALDPVTGFSADALDFFSSYPNASFEIRTKSTNIRSLLARKALPNVVVAFSLTPEAISHAVEHKVPPLLRRLQAIKKLADHGWSIGLRFDPIIYADHFKKQYSTLINDVFQHVQPSQVHSVSLGPLRFPRGMLERITHLYPADKMLAAASLGQQGAAGASSTEDELLRFVNELLKSYLPDGRLFSCY